MMLRSLIPIELPQNLYDYRRNVLCPYKYFNKALDISRIFVMWLHDVNGLRDHTRFYGEELSCDRDGYFAELITPYDVTQQVMKILQIMERPLVAQRNQRILVFSDVYANVEVHVIF